MKRVLSFLLCCTLCVGVFAYRPMQVKAVAGVDDAAVVGSMALASYLSATGFELSVIEGGAATVTAGLGAVAGEYAAATGVAASGEAFLGSVAAGTALSAAGTIILTAAVVAACAAFAHWLYTEYALDSHTESVPVYSYTDDKETIEINIDGYPPFSFQYTDIGGTGYLSSSSYFTNQKVGSYSVERFPVKPIIYDFKEWPIINNKHSFCYATAHYTSSGEFIDTPSYATVEVRDNYSLSNPHGGFAGVGTALNTTGSSRGGFFTYEGLTWLRSGSSLMLCEVSSYNSCYYIGNFFGTLTNYFTRYVFDSTYYAKKLSIAATPTYSIPEIQPNQSMEITIPSAAPGSTLADLAEIVSQQIANNEFTASYTITESEPVAEPSSMLDYVADIWRRIKALPETISSAVKSVFEPDAALLTEITTTFNNKFGWLETLYHLGEDLLGMTADSAPPVIYIHLEDAEGQFRYGGTEKTLDMSWYQPYKEDVDNILSGFMWLSFLWLVFKRAADIINGAGMVSDYEFYMSVPINQPRLEEHKK